MKLYRLLPFVGCVCVLLNPVASLGQESAGRRARPCVVISGTDSHVTGEGCYRITSAREWARLWQAHKGHKSAEKYNDFYDPLTLPEIDFDNYMVIAVFRGGDANNAGLDVESVDEKKDQLVVRFWDKHYQRDFASMDDEAKDKVGVYGFFVVPRCKKQVIVQENAEGYYRSQVPDWKELARIPSLRER
jgi:hypothetical protein